MTRHFLASVCATVAANAVLLAGPTAARGEGAEQDEPTSLVDRNLEEQRPGERKEWPNNDATSTCVNGRR